MSQNRTGPIRIENFMTRYMNEVGGGNINGNVDGSTTPVNFEFTPSTGEFFVLDRLIIYGLGTSNVASQSYVDLTKLTNGIEITFQNSGGIIKDITDTVPIKTNDDLAHICYDSRQNLFGANPRSVTMRYSFFKETGWRGILLDGDLDQKLIITINDNLTSLIEHRFRVGAYKL